MAYSLEVAENLNRIFEKIAKKDKTTFEAVNKKVNQILENPHHYKPLRAPLQNCRRVHISGSFVLIYQIDERKQVVKLLEFEHHDNAYG